MSTQTQIPFIRNKFYLVGLAGPSGSGKNTIAQEIRYQRLLQVADFKFPAENALPQIIEFAFATPLKELCAQLFGWSGKDFSVPERKSDPHPYWGITPRQAAQFIGTEVGRELITKQLLKSDRSIWISHLENEINQRVLRAVSPRLVLITDVRFEDEVHWIQSHGGMVIYLSRTNRALSPEGGIENHASENFEPIMDHVNKFVENNGTPAECATVCMDIIRTHFNLN